MNVVDSSAWLEYFTGSERAELFAEAIEDPANLLVPTVCLAEVASFLKQRHGDDAALQAFAVMSQGTVVDLDGALALETAGPELPLASAVVLAVARRYGAELWTQDPELAEFPGVRYFKKKKSKD